MAINKNGPTIDRNSLGGAFDTTNSQGADRMDSQGGSFDTSFEGPQGQPGPPGERGSEGMDGTSFTTVDITDNGNNNFTLTFGGTSTDASVSFTVTTAGTETAQDILDLLVGYTGDTNIPNSLIELAVANITGLQTALDAKQDNLTADQVADINRIDTIESDLVAADAALGVLIATNTMAINAEEDARLLADNDINGRITNLDIRDFDTVPLSGSTNSVESGGVFSAIQDATIAAGTGSNILVAADATAREAIATGDLNTGDLVIELDFHTLYYWNGTQWVQVRDDNTDVSIPTVVDDNAALQALLPQPVGDPEYQRGQLFIQIDEGLVHWYDESLNLGAGGFVIASDIGFRTIEDLEDVTITSPVEASAFVWDDTNSRWINQSRDGWIDGSTLRTEFNQEVIDRGDEDDVVRAEFAAADLLKQNILTGVSDVPGLQTALNDKQDNLTADQIADIDRIDTIESTLEAADTALGGRIDNLSIPSITANPDGDDGASLTRIAIDGTNFNIAGGGGTGSGIEVLAADPASPTEGQVWYNSTDDVIRYYDGTDVDVVVDRDFYDATTGITVHHAVSSAPVNVDFSGLMGNSRAGTITIPTAGDYTISTTIEIDSVIGNFGQGQWMLSLAEVSTGTVVATRNITVNSDQSDVAKNLVADGLTAQAYTLTATLTTNNNVNTWSIFASASINDHDSIDVDPLVYEDLDARYLQLDDDFLTEAEGDTLYAPLDDTAPLARRGTWQVAPGDDVTFEDARIEDNELSLQGTVDSVLRASGTSSDSAGDPATSALTTTHFRFDGIAADVLQDIATGETAQTGWVLLQPQEDFIARYFCQIDLAATATLNGVSEATLLTPVDDGTTFNVLFELVSAVDALIVGGEVVSASAQPTTFRFYASTPFQILEIADIFDTSNISLAINLANQANIQIGLNSIGFLDIIDADIIGGAPQAFVQNTNTIVGSFTAMTAAPRVILTIRVTAGNPTGTTTDPGDEMTVPVPSQWDVFIRQTPATGGTGDAIVSDILTPISGGYLVLEPTGLTATEGTLVTYDVIVRHSDFSGVILATPVVTIGGTIEPELHPQFTNYLTDNYDNQAEVDALDAEVQQLASTSHSVQVLSDIGNIDAIHEFATERFTPFDSTDNNILLGADDVDGSTIVVARFFTGDLTARILTSTDASAIGVGEEVHVITDDGNEIGHFTTSVLDGETTHVISHGSGASQFWELTGTPTQNLFQNVADNATDRFSDQLDVGLRNAYFLMSDVLSPVTDADTGALTAAISSNQLILTWATAVPTTSYITGDLFSFTHTVVGVDSPIEFGIEDVTIDAASRTWSVPFTGIDQALTDAAVVRAGLTIGSYAVRENESLNYITGNSYLGSDVPALGFDNEFLRRDAIQAIADDGDEEITDRLNSIIAASHHEWHADVFGVDFTNTNVTTIAVGPEVVADVDVTLDDTNDTFTINRDGTHYFTINGVMLTTTVTQTGTQTLTPGIYDADNNLVVAFSTTTIVRDDIVIGPEVILNETVSANIVSGTVLRLRGVGAVTVNPGGFLPGVRLRVLGGDLRITTTQEGIGGGGGASTFADLTGRIALDQLPTHDGTDEGRVLQTTLVADGWELADPSGGFDDGQVVRLGTASTLGADGSAVAIATTDDVRTDAEINALADTRADTRIAAADIDDLSGIPAAADGTGTVTRQLVYTVADGSYSWIDSTTGGTTTINVAAFETIDSFADRTTEDGIFYQGRLRRVVAGTTITFDIRVLRGVLATGVITTFQDDTNTVEATAQTEFDAIVADPTSVTYT